MALTPRPPPRPPNRTPTTAADITKVAERTISDDLEFLISQAVDPKKADYAGGWGRARVLAPINIAPA